MSLFRNYLDDQESAVVVLSREVLPRIHEDLYGWFLGKYWKELETLADDSTMSVFYRRGIWFTREILLMVDEPVFSQDEWHNMVGRFPKILGSVCNHREVFTDIGERAQDSLVGSLLDEAGTHPSALRRLETLGACGVLTTRQQERFEEKLSGMTIDAVRASGLQFKTCYPIFLTAIQSGEFDKQNLAIRTIQSRGPNQLSELSVEQKENLGRRILYAGYLSAWATGEFLSYLSQNAEIWPVSLLRGIALELFVGEDNTIWIKSEQLSPALSAIDAMHDEQRNCVIAAVVDALDQSEIGLFSPARLDSVASILSSYTWSLPLVEILSQKLAKSES